MNNPMTYIQNGDYLIPDLKLSQQPEKPLGKYGRMRKTCPGHFLGARRRAYRGAFGKWSVCLQCGACRSGRL